MATPPHPTAADAAPAGDPARWQRSWYFYDWANSAYVTTTATVLFGPYLTVVAKRAACPGQASDLDCAAPLHVLGVPVAAGSVALYAVTASTLLSALLLPVLGALIDRSGGKRRLLGGFAWAGALAAAAMVLVAGADWQLGVLLVMLANLALGCSLVIYDSILIDIATPDQRDAVSTRGWGLGYLGGGLLLAANLGLVSGHHALGLSTEAAVRLSLLSAGLWWAGFTLVPYLGLRGLPEHPAAGARGDDRRGLLARSVAQLGATLAHLRGYPQTLTFLLAYLFYNDGIQTVISAASIFGQEQLKLSSGQLISTILVVQFVGFGGSVVFGRVAARYGARRTVLASLVLWCLVVGLGYLVPERQFGAFLALAVLIGLVLGGSQALSRSLYSQLVPRGREAEYFSLYQAAERGTSWFGTLLFGVVFQVTGSYRNAIVALVVFFVLGGALLSRVDVRQGILAAGNDVPAVL